jgi:archaemetzincin
MQNLNKALIQGIAESDLKTATISTYKLKKEAKDAQTFAADLAKVARHEMGHILGLPHCNSKHCLMLGAYQFKHASGNFCQACLEKIDKKYMKKLVLTAYKGKN